MTTQYATLFREWFSPVLDAVSPTFDFAAAITQDQYPDIPKLDPKTLVPALNPTLVVDGAGLDALARYLTRVDNFAWDYETNVVPGFFHRRARTLQIGDRNEQYIIDLLAFAETPEQLYMSQGFYRGQGGAFRAIHKNLQGAVDMVRPFWKLMDPIIKVVAPALCSKSHLKIGYNLEFEYVVSKWCLGMRTWNFYDCYRAERNITNGAVPVHQKDFWALDDAVRRYCKFQISKEKQTSFDLCSPLDEDQVIYTALDCRLPYAIKAAQESKIKKGGLQWSVQIDMDAIPAFGDMRLNGMLASKEKWTGIINQHEEELKHSIEDMDRHFIPVVGRKVKWDQENIDRLYQVYKSYDEKSPEELVVSAEIRACKKDPVRKAELMEIRKAHEDARKAAKVVAKAEYTVEKAKGNAKARSDYEKMEGDAAINYNAPAQLLAALHAGKFGLTKGNLKESNDKAMEKHSDLPVIKAIRNYRSLKKSLGTYGYRWITDRDVIDEETGKYGYVDPDTGRIHARFQQFGADTGRPSCTDPNVLNIPPMNREAFVSREGYDMVCKDCAGQELRILTEYSKEQAWVEAFLKKQDLHSISAEMINTELWHKSANHDEYVMMQDGKQVTIPPCAYFHKDKKKCKCPKHVEVRNDYKAFNFGVVYDKSAFSFAIELNKPKDVVEVMLDAWKRRFAQTQRTLESLRSTGYEKGEARTKSGRRRFMRPVAYEQAKKLAAEKYGPTCDHNKIMQTMQSLVAAVKREAGNMPIQGTGADLMLLAMGCGFDPEGNPYGWHVWEPEYGALLENYVYDEFVVESPEETSERVDVSVGDCIIRAGAEFVKVVPMESDGLVSKRWKK